MGISAQGWPAPDMLLSGAATHTLYGPLNLQGFQTVCRCVPQGWRALSRLQRQSPPLPACLLGTAWAFQGRMRAATVYFCTTPQGTWAASRNKLHPLCLSGDHGNQSKEHEALSRCLSPQGASVRTASAGPTGGYAPNQNQCDTHVLHQCCAAPGRGALGQHQGANTWPAVSAVLGSDLSQHLAG